MPNLLCVLVACLWASSAAFAQPAATSEAHPGSLEVDHVATPENAAPEPQEAADSGDKVDALHTPVPEPAVKNQEPQEKPDVKRDSQQRPEHRLTRSLASDADWAQVKVDLFIAVLTMAGVFLLWRTLEETRKTLNATEAALQDSRENLKLNQDVAERAAIVTYAQMQPRFEISRVNIFLLFSGVPNNGSLSGWATFEITNVGKTDVEYFEFDEVFSLQIGDPHEYFSEAPRPAIKVTEHGDGDRSLSVGRTMKFDFEIETTEPFMESDWSEWLESDRYGVWKSGHIIFSGDLQIKDVFERDVHYTFKLVDRMRNVAPRSEERFAHGSGRITRHWDESKRKAKAKAEADEAAKAKTKD